MKELDPVQQHYATAELRERFEQALQAAGLGSGPIEWPQLAAADQFHARGLQATKELAAALHPEAGASVLDVGCGFGGPARFLAATYGCRVTGIDLTSAYIEIADMLTRRTGLTDRLTFLQGDALELTFPDESFDHAWTQHVAMNIADKARLYRGVHRVLKPGGRLAIYDVVSGSGEALIFPVPWAREPAISFLATSDGITRDLHSAGFQAVSAVDKTPEALEWFAGLRPAAPSPGGVDGLSLASILGPEVRQMAANFAQNLTEGRAHLMQIIARKDKSN